MAYDEYMADRVRNILRGKGVPFGEKKMMGGLCFMVDDKMCLGIDRDKASGKNRLMARIGEAVYAAALQKEGCGPMDITGKALKGFVLVEEAALDQQEALDYWVQLCLDFNPKAKKSRK